jgi:hypothetical protein
LNIKADEVVSSAITGSGVLADEPELDLGSLEPEELDPPEPKASNVPRIIYGAYVISILLTTVEIPDLNVISSISAVLCLFVLLCFSFKQYILHPMVWLLMIMSIASGFTGVLLDDRRPESIVLCEDVFGDECIEQSIEGLYVFGLPTKDISRMAAVKAGKLNKINFNHQVRGYGLISLARVTVVGS